MTSRKRWVSLFSVHVVVVHLRVDKWADKKLDHNLNLHVMSFLVWNG